MAGEHHAQLGDPWQRLDSAAFGIIYGSVTVLALLMAMGSHPGSALTSAAALFGSILGIALAKAFAEVMSDAIEARARISRQAFARSWAHAQTTLIAANLPTLFFIAAAAGLGTTGSAIALSQVYCIGLLMLVGGRVGWRLDTSWLSAVLGALFAGGVGLALALLKHVIH